MTSTTDIHTSPIAEGNSSGFLHISRESFPNLSEHQITQLRNIGPLPRYVYRAAPDITLLSPNGHSPLFPMMPREVNWGFLNDSIDAAHLPPATQSGHRKVLYVGDANTASGFAHIHSSGAGYWEGSGSSERFIHGDTLTIQECYNKSGAHSYQTLEEYAKSNGRLYRLSMEDVLKKMTPNTVIVRDTGQQGKAWAIVGDLTGPVPAVHIQKTGENVFKDTSTGVQTHYGYSGIEALEPSPIPQPHQQQQAQHTGAPDAHAVHVDAPAVSSPHPVPTPHESKPPKGKLLGALGAPLAGVVAGGMALFRGESAEAATLASAQGVIEATPVGIAVAAVAGRPLEATYRGYEQIPVLGTLVTEIARPIARSLGHDVDAGAVESAVVAANAMAMDARTHAQQQAAAYGATIAAHLPELQAKGWGNVLGNHDGKLEAHEVVKALREHGVTSLAQLDKDGNGVTGKEITDMLTQPLPASGKGRGR